MPAESLTSVRESDQLTALCIIPRAIAVSDRAKRRRRGRGGLDRGRTAVGSDRRVRIQSHGQDVV